MGTYTGNTGMGHNRRSVIVVNLKRLPEPNGVDVRKVDEDSSFIQSFNKQSAGCRESSVSSQRAHRRTGRADLTIREVNQSHPQQGTGRSCQKLSGAPSRAFPP